MAATVAGADLGVPVVQTFHALGAVKQRHQGSADTSPPGRLAVESRLARSVDRVIASCRDEVRELLLLGGQRSSIDVVPCGVDTAHFTPDGPAAPRGRRPRLLALGRMVPRKGVDDAIRMLARVPAAELVVAGGGPAGGPGPRPRGPPAARPGPRASTWPTGSSCAGRSGGRSCRR